MLRRMKYICLIALCLTVLGCGGHRDLTEYSLDEGSFDAEAMLKIKQESGLNIPAGSKGLLFHHLPPVDPINFAKIQIPTDEVGSLVKEIKALTFSGTHFPKNFANERCRWWPAELDNIIMSKEAFCNGYCVEVYLVKESDNVILYIKYFTI